MKCSFQSLTFLLCVTFAYGASVRQAGFPDQTISYYTPNGTYFSNKDNDITVVNLKDGPTALQEQNDFDVIGQMIAEASRQMFEIFSTMEVSEKSLQSLVQLVVPLVAAYFEPYSQILVPLLSGIATVIIR
ncbi:hypothetical protein O0L34_g9212 [Tuta absoluta]|nr:hypothetical protein O0L34_g9212 [Tuta absoluta]